MRALIGREVFAWENVNMVMTSRCFSFHVVAIFFHLSWHFNNHSFKRKTIITKLTSIITCARLHVQDFVTCKNFSFNQCHNRVLRSFFVSHCAFCKLQRKFGFFCSVNHLSRPLRKKMFTCDWCISIHFVCFCVSRFVACDWTVSGNGWLVFFEAFYDLSYSCLLQE